jgi:Fur family ferric uptake transcriptional regulator
MPSAEPTLEEQCAARGIRMTGQRRVIARILQDSADHPDVEELHARAAAVDPNISLSTVYRTVNLFEEAGLIEKHDFKDSHGARFEQAPGTHHDHLIDIRTGKVIEFSNSEIEAIQEAIAERLGYRLVDHRLELYGVPLGGSAKNTDHSR